MKSFFKVVWTLVSLTNSLQGFAAEQCGPEVFSNSEKEAENEFSVAIQSYFFPEQHDTFALSTSGQIQLLLYMFYLKRKLQMNLTIVTVVK